jgi:hypothetical protein
MGLLFKFTDGDVGPKRYFAPVSLKSHVIKLDSLSIRAMKDRL